MLPKFHFLIALVASVVLFFLNWHWWQIFLFFTTAFFIDVDHYLWFVWKRKSFNLVRACRYFSKPIKERHIMIFHTIEAFIVLIVLSALSFNIFFPMLLGFIVHNLTDEILMIFRKEKGYKRAFSIIYHLVKRK